MKNKAHDLATYSFSEGECFLLDANIWLYLFPAPSAPPAPPYMQKYSSAIKNMFSSKTQLVLDALILSEYLNRYCRIEHQASAPGTQFKQFRNSPSFKNVGSTAAVFAKKIVGLCQRHNSSFGTADIDQVLVDFEAGISDFNDGLIADSCRQHGWKLITNDGDFTHGGIELLTVNSKLLTACK